MEQRAAARRPGIVFFAPAYAGAISIHDNSFSNSDAGIRTSGVPGTDLIGEPVSVDGNSFSAVGNPILVTIPGSIYATDSLVNGVSVPSAFHGGPDANSFVGTAGADAVYGNGGDDTLNGGAGNDLLDGGAGSDTAVLSGTRLNYSFASDSNGVTVTDGTANRDGTDTLVAIEKVQFADRTFTLDAIVNNVAAKIGDMTRSDVDENSGQGTLIGTVQATDANLEGGDFLTYELLDNAGGLFAIDATNGAVTVLDQSELDAEQGQSYDIIVRVTDAGGETTDKKFTITINDLDEFDISKPIDADGAANTIAENSAVGSLVGIDVNAVDEDATTNIVSYALEDSAGGRFTIDAETGRGADGAVAQLREATSHNIIVRAFSTDGSSNAQVFTVNVTNVNEAP
jgi:hypothetical protein